MKIKEIAELTVAELLRRKKELREECLHLRLQQRSGQLDRPHRFRQIRREVARIETVVAIKRAAMDAAAAAAAPPAPAPAPAADAASPAGDAGGATKKRPSRRKARTGDAKA